MKRIIFLSQLLFCIAASAASSSTNTLQVRVADFVEVVIAGQDISLTPQATLGPAPASEFLHSTADGDGQATFSNLPAGLYTLTMIRSGVPSLLLKLPDSASTSQASDLVQGDFRFPAPTSAWTPAVFRGVPYLFPPVQGAAGSVLTDTNGAGKLAWSIPTSTASTNASQFGAAGGTLTVKNGPSLTNIVHFGTMTNAAFRNLTNAGAFTLAGTTNQVTFGASNLPPASAVAPVKWISVQVTGETNAYRLPLYE